MNTMGAYEIEFQPIGRRGPCPAGDTLLDCAHRLRVELVALCGGTGKCGGCKLKTIEGSFSEQTPVERRVFSGVELEAGWRVVCQYRPHSDCRLLVPPESPSAPQRGLHPGLPARTLLSGLDASRSSNHDGCSGGDSSGEAGE